MNKNKITDFKVGRTYIVSADDVNSHAWSPGHPVVVIGKRRFKDDTGSYWALETVSREGNHLAGLIQWILPNHLRKRKGKLKQ